MLAGGNGRIHILRVEDVGCAVGRGWLLAPEHRACRATQHAATDGPHDATECGFLQACRAGRVIVGGKLLNRVLYQFFSAFNCRTFERAESNAFGQRGFSELLCQLGAALATHGPQRPFLRAEFGLDGAHRTSAQRCNGL